MNKDSNKNTERGGQSTTKGISYQNYAAVALFMQFLKYGDFSHILLEGKNREDFTLFFDNPKRRIECQAKCYKNTIKPSQIKEILGKINRKGMSFGENDEILIVCPKVSEKFKKEIKYLEYFPKDKIDYLKTKYKFEDSDISLLFHLRFWEIEREEVEKLAVSLFFEYLPFFEEKDIFIFDGKGLFNQLFVSKFLKNFERGEVYYKRDFQNELTSSLDVRAKRATSVAPDVDFQDRQEQIRKILESVEKGKSNYLRSSDLEALSCQPSFMIFILRKLSKKNNIDLKKWNALFQASSLSQYIGILISEIFQKNLDSKENREYVINFVREKLSHLGGFYYTYFINSILVKILSEILKKDSVHLKVIFDIVKGLIELDKKKYFYVINQTKERQQGLDIANLLFDLYENSFDVVKEGIVDLILKEFKIIEENIHFRQTPKRVYEILKIYLCENDFNNFYDRFKKITQGIIKQFNFYYKGILKSKFTGFESFPIPSFWWGDDYTFSDFNFIKIILEPSLTDYYDYDSKRALDFIFKICIFPENKISSKNPDFLIRASIPILVKEFFKKQTTLSKEVEDLLKNLVEFEKGSPKKIDIILEALKREEKRDEDIIFFIKEIFPNSFIPKTQYSETFFSKISNNGNKYALKFILYRYKDPEYIEKIDFFYGYHYRNVLNFLQNYFSEGFEVFKKIIKSQNFLSQDEIDIYKWSSLLKFILKKDLSKGIEILSEFFKLEKIDKKHQLFVSAILDSSGADFISEYSIVSDIYDKVLSPFFERCNNDIDKIIDVFSESQARLNIVNFSKSLIEIDKGDGDFIEKALMLLQNFSEDPDPKKNYKSINNDFIISEDSVRGACAYNLKFFITSKARKYIKDVLALTEKFLKDDNPYVQQAVCSCLCHLIKFRFAKVSGTEKMFLSDDEDDAIFLIRKIEEIFLEFLNEKSLLPKELKSFFSQSIVAMASNMRTIDLEKIEVVLNVLYSFSEEVLGKSIHLFLYYAEFAERNFKDFSKRFPRIAKLYNLEKFDENIYKNKFNSLCKNSSIQIKLAISWVLYDLVGTSRKEQKDKFFESNEIAMKYFSLLIDLYDQDLFSNIFMYIKENIEDVPDDIFDRIFSFWKECIEIENRSLKEKLDTHAFYYPYLFHSEILKIIFDKKGDDAFLKAFSLFLNRPKNVCLGDISELVDKILFQIKNKIQEILSIFERLIKHDESYYEIKQRWLSFNV